MATDPWGAWQPDTTSNILTDVPASAAGGQLVTYTSGTPENPPNTQQAAIAYDPAGILPTMGWDIASQTWK